MVNTCDAKSCSIRRRSSANEELIIISKTGLPMDVTWDGVIRSDALSDSAASVRIGLADAAKDYEWSMVFDILSENSELVNSCRPDGSSLYAPIHQAAYAGASTDVIRQLIELGAWRTLQNARGERAVDVAERKGHYQLREILTPTLNHQVPIGVLLKIQSNFHDVIRGRIDSELPNHSLRLPELEPLLELDRPQTWFPVPGMYGGFNYFLEATGVDAKLVVESWCRVAGGSGQRHEITSQGSRLVAEGFV